MAEVGGDEGKERQPDGDGQTNVKRGFVKVAPVHSDTHQKARRCTVAFIREMSS